MKPETVKAKKYLSYPAGERNMAISYQEIIF